jgi:hypothetical protein
MGKSAKIQRTMAEGLKSRLFRNVEDFNLLHSEVLFTREDLRALDSRIVDIGIPEVVVVKITVTVFPIPSHLLWKFDPAKPSSEPR